MPFFIILGSQSSDDTTREYRYGFNECAYHVLQYLSDTDSLELSLRMRLMDHLASYVQEVGFERLSDDGTNLNKQSQGQRKGQGQFSTVTKERSLSPTHILSDMNCPENAHVTSSPSFSGIDDITRGWSLPRGQSGDPNKNEQLLFSRNFPNNFYTSSTLHRKYTDEVQISNNVANTDLSRKKNMYGPYSLSNVWQPYPW